MKNIFMISILSIVIVGLFSVPSMALSGNADNFVKACHALDAPFPPQGWDKADLRDAAIEVLNSIENGSMNGELTGFCLKAIGSTGYAQDLPRILAYKDKMPRTVLISLSGFSHPDAINYLIKWVTDKEVTTRELAAISLSKMDFGKLDKPTYWYAKVRDKLIAVRDNEKEDWFKTDLTKMINELVPPPIVTK